MSPGISANPNLVDNEGGLKYARSTHEKAMKPHTLTMPTSDLLMKELSDDESITFYFARGYIDSQPPQWLEEQLEGPPHLRFLQWDLTLLDTIYQNHLEKYGAPTRKLESMPSIDVVEKQREDDELLGSFFGSTFVNDVLEPWSVGVALEYLHNIIDDEGPFHGVVGVSEGAAVAATLLVEDIQHCKAMQARSDFRCALFYVGSPALSEDGMRIMHSDTDGQVINIPTCHIMGENDIFKKGSDELLKLCDSDKALTITDLGGHRIPQDMGTNKQVADWIREQERHLIDEQVAR